mgnify:CR=1 FL=1
MKSVLEYKKATINITEEKSIKNINFSIAENEFIYLIGKTGSGKSSILRTMYADKNLSEGDLKILDIDLKKIKKKEVPFLRRKIGIVFPSWRDDGIDRQAEIFISRAKICGYDNQGADPRRRTWCL